MELDKFKRYYKERNKNVVIKDDDLVTKTAG
jgi:hypothetical protein